VASRFLGWFGVAAAVWAVSSLLDPPWIYGLWAIALSIELAAPIPLWRVLRDAPVDRRHLPERFGLLVLIVLGESILAVVFAVSEVSWDVGSATAAVAGFVIAASLWWIYFDFLEEGTGALSMHGITGGLVYTYVSYFVVAGLTTLGAGVQLGVLDAGGVHRYDGTSWVLSAGLARPLVPYNPRQAWLSSQAPASVPIRSCRPWERAAWARCIARATRSSTATLR